MNRFASIWVSGAVEHLRRLRQREGAEIAEFAVSIPLLAVFVVGIFDFGSAFTVKQKISNVAL
jgi:Flp pilus assembly protein TadG